MTWSWDADPKFKASGRDADAAGTMLVSSQRRSVGREEGFSLIELLVVILIIGILAAIAIPSFLNHKAKASDVAAKELARTAQTAAETIGTDNGGRYSTVTPTTLNATESTIPIGVSTTNAYLSAASGTATTFVVTTMSTTGDTYTITRNANGSVSRTCANAIGQTTCLNGTW